MPKLALFLLVLLVVALGLWIMEAIQLGPSGLRLGVYTILALVVAGLLARMAIRK